MNVVFKVYWNNPIEMVAEAGTQQLTFEVPLGAIISNPSSGGGTASYPSLTGNAAKVLTVNATEDDVEWTTAVTQVYVDQEIVDLNATLSTSISSKADVNYVDTQDSLLQDQIDLKADAIATSQSLDTKAEAIAVNQALALKADVSYVDTQDGLLQTQINTKADTTIVNQVLTLAQTNEMKIGTKADQVDLETAEQQVELNRLSILTKADITALAMLAQLVDTKADQAYVNQQITTLVGSAPEALNTVYELAAAIQDNDGIIDTLNQSVANRVRFDVATQALTEIQKQNARTNIGAETLGTAATLVAAITAASIGAATAAQGTKADTALQSADVAPVALSGLFNSLVGQNKIFDVVFGAYALGSNTAVVATDTLGQIIGKLQAQINNVKPSATMMPVNVQTGTAYTLALADAGGCVEMSNAAANTLTIPPNSTVAYGIGTTILIRQMGAGQTTLVAGSGVMIRNPHGTLKLFKQYTSVALHKRGTDEWCIEGNLAES